MAMVIEGISGGNTNDHLFNKTSTEFTYKLIELRNKELKIETSGYPYILSTGEKAIYGSAYTLVQ